MYNMDSNKPVNCDHLYNGSEKDKCTKVSKI